MDLQTHSKLSTQLDWKKFGEQTAAVLNKADGGELFAEHSEQQSLTLESGQVKKASHSINRGAGLRGIFDESVAYTYTTDLSDAGMSKLYDALPNMFKSLPTAKQAIKPLDTQRVDSYGPQNPVDTHLFADKIQILQDIDAYAKSKAQNALQIIVSLSQEHRDIVIIKNSGELLVDVRPMSQLRVQIVLPDESGGMEAGSYGLGGRDLSLDLLSSAVYQPVVDEAIRQAEVRCAARPAPAGEMPVVLGPGWPGVMLHEAVGHGLEGDFNRKKISVFSGKVGEQVAASNVTVIDQGNIPGRRGSLNIDDEGQATGETVLIENGILKGYMQDQLNAHLMGESPTGNGRRESFAHVPMPRMTNTFMTNGKYDHDELIASIDEGIYAANFGGGQVDITSGSFVFDATEAYKVENGKIVYPIKGATLIGNGPDVMTKVTMVANNQELDPGIGTCGKEGQGVPVGVGQPSLKISQITVGGTAV